MEKRPEQRKFKFFGDKVTTLLFAICIFFFGLLVLTQILLKNKSTREIFTPIEKYEKISYASNTAFKEGYAVIKLEEGKPSEKIEIWFNGEKVDVLDEKSKKIVIDCDGVFEIKNDSGKKIVVSAESVSDNIEFLMSNKPEIASGIRVICSVCFKIE